MQPSNKLLIVYKDPKVHNPVASHAGLGVTAINTARVLREHGYDATPESVVDGYEIRNNLRSGKWSCTHLVMCAPFFDTPFLRALCNEFPHVIFVVTFHSNVGFLGVDKWAMSILLEQIELQRTVANFRVAGNNPRFCRGVRSAFKAECLLLPNLYPLGKPVHRSPWSCGTLHIGAFGAIRVLKNLPTAAWAALIMANELKTNVDFHISSGRVEGAGADAVLITLKRVADSSTRLTLVEEPWAPWDTFRTTVVGRMHLLMQPSYTESFNGVTADGISMGVPSVTGSAIDWVPKNWIANVDDVNDVAHTGCMILPAPGNDSPTDGYKALRRYLDSSLDAWDEFLCSQRFSVMQRACRAIRRTIALH